MELLQAQVNCYLADKNTVFKIAYTKKLTHEVEECMKISVWEDLVRHMQSLQDLPEELVRDEMLESIIINTVESSFEYFSPESSYDSCS
jgi:hypothetical protein